MQRILLLTVLLFASVCGFAQTWTATQGPYGGFISRMKKAPNGNIYSIVSQKLYRSTNSGDSWTEVLPTTPTTLYLNDVMIDSDGKLYAAYWSQLYSSADNGVTWTNVATNLFQNVQYIERVGPDNVFVVWGNSGVYVSIDKGISWVQISTANWSGTPGLWANSAGDIFYGTQSGSLMRHAYQGLTTNWSTGGMVEILNAAPSTVNAVTFDATGKVLVSSFNVVYKSTGSTAPFTFNDITTTSGLAPTYSYFNGPFAAAPDGTIYLFNTYNNGVVHKSTNQGTSWTTTTSPVADFGANVTYPPVFISSSTVLLSTSGEVLKTTDSGATWSAKSSSLTGGTLESIVVANTTGRIIATRSSRSYYTSTDGGNTWTSVPLANSVRQAKKLSDGTILLYGNGYFYRSTDNGASFTTDNTFRSNNTVLMEATDGSVFAFYSLWDGTAYKAKIGKSTDKGATWTENTTTPGAGLWPTGDFYPNFAAIDGSDNILASFHDYTTQTNKVVKVNGTTVTSITLPSSTTPNNVFFLNGKFYVSNFSSYYYSSDAGTTWTTVGFSGNKVFPLKNASYSGIAVSRNGSLYVSQNDGGSWANTTLPSSTAYITDIATDATGDFYASASGGPVYKYTNELLVDPATLPPYINFNWQPLNGPFGGNVQKIEISNDGNTMYAVSQNRLWKYTTASGVWTKKEIYNAAVPTQLLSIVDVEMNAAGDVFVLPTLSPSQRIYKSIDGAATWAEIVSSGLPAVSNGLRRIDVLTDGSILLYGNDGTNGKIYKSVNAGTTFTTQFTSAYLVALGAGSSRITAINPVNGTLVTMSDVREGLLVSTDNGTTWTVKSTASVANASGNLGFVGSYMYDKDGNLLLQSIVDATIPLWDARVSKSSNDGTTWTMLSTPTVPNAAGTNNYSKRIITLGSGAYLMCIQSLFDCYRSVDGGATWTNIGNVGDVFVWSTTSGSTSYVIGSGNAGALKTTDNGLTFSPFMAGMPHPSPNSISILNDKDLLVGATRPYYSSDFGQNFSLATLEPAATFVQVKDSLIGYGSRLLLKSKDGGKTWKSFGADNTFFTYLTADASGTGFYAATSTTIQYSSNLTTWQNIPLSGLPVDFSIVNLAIDQGGVIYAIINDPNTDTNKLFKIIFGSATDISSLIGTTFPVTIKTFNNKIYLYDSRGIMYKSSDGETWAQGPAPSGNSFVVANNYLFIPSGGMVLWISRDDGNSWQSVGDSSTSGGTFVNIAINEYDGYAYGTVTNGVARKSGNMVIPDDKTKPIVATISPANNATSVSLKPTLSITFDEITNSVSSKLIRLFDSAQPALPLLTFDASTATRSGKTWSVTVPSTLAFSKTYFVVVDAGAFVDIFGNACNAISSSTAWRFTTKAGPSVASLSPSSGQNATTLNTTLVVTFGEPVAGVAGKNLNIYKSTVPTAAVATLAADVGVSSGNTLTFTLPAPLEFATAYFAKFDDSAFSTTDGGVFSALTANTDWTFTTRSAPTVATLSPANNATAVNANTTLAMTLSENASLVGTNKMFVNNITVPATPAISVDLSSATSSGATKTFALPSSLNYGTVYSVTFEASAFTSGDGGLFSLLTSTGWQFTTRPGPTVSTTVPSNNATNVAISTPLSITFSENVSVVAANKMYITSTAQPGTPTFTINLSTATVTGSTVSLALPGDLANSTAYAVTFDANSFRATADNGLFSVYTTTGWGFTTVSPADTKAPTISFSSDAFSKGSSSKVFSPAITDEVGVAEAKIFYRSITSTGNESSANLVFNTSTTKYDVTIQESDFGKMGLEFYFTAADAAGNVARSPATGYYYSYITFPTAATNPAIPGGLLGVGGTVESWRIISVPYQLSDAKIATVFSELGGTDKTKWRLITYKNSTTWDEYPNNFSSLVQGKGYFINMTQTPANGLSIDGATTPSFNKANVFKMNLSPGWNQVGNPYTFKIVWSEVLAANPTVTTVSTKLKKYTNDYVDGTDLEVFEGAFVMNTGTSAVSLDIPITGSQAGGRTQDSDIVSTTSGWVVPIQVKVGDYVNSFGGIGMNRDATDGIDHLDDFNPPSFDKYAELSFVHPEHFLAKATRDIVREQESYEWLFSVETNISGSASLHWNTASIANHSNDLYLLDESTGWPVNMREQTSYGFNPKQSGKFRILFGNNLASRIRTRTVTLSGVHPNPIKHFGTIRFSLPDGQSTYRLSLDIFDAMGKKVVSVAQGDFYPGYHEAMWIPQEAHTNGMYTYRLTVGIGGRTEVLNGKLILIK